MNLAFDAAKLRARTVKPRPWWRVHHRAHGPIAFNASGAGNARFSPIVDAHGQVIHGQVIPTLYAGATQAVALMETVLHDLPWPSSGFILTLPDPADEVRRMACVRAERNLKLGDLSSIGLRRIGLAKADLIESHKPAYPSSREFAARVHAQRPDLQGLIWPSRQDDRDDAIVLFGDRLQASELSVVTEGLHITVDEGILSVLVELLDALDASVYFDARRA